MENTLLSFTYLICITFLNSSTVMSQKYETQEYQVVDQIGNAEIRFYPSAAMIKVSSGVNRSNNFGKLFRYISGNNSGSEKIAMTTPVYIYDDNRTMEFVLPDKYLSQDIPVPNNSELNTYISDPKYFAAIRYSGYSNQGKVIKHKNELESILTKNGLEIISDFYILSYDAPTKFYNRRNEILIQVNYSD